MADQGAGWRPLAGDLAGASCPGLDPGALALLPRISGA